MNLLRGDAINDAMLKGLTSALNSELKFLFKQTADAVIKGIVEELIKRLEISVSSFEDFQTNDRRVKVEVLFKKEGE